MTCVCLSVVQPGPLVASGQDWADEAGSFACGSANLITPVFACGSLITQLSKTVNPPLQRLTWNESASQAPFKGVLGRKWRHAHQLLVHVCLPSRVPSLARTEKAGGEA